MILSFGILSNLSGDLRANIGPQTVIRGTAGKRDRIHFIGFVDEKDHERWGLGGARASSPIRTHCDHVCARATVLFSMIIGRGRRSRLYHPKGECPR